MSFEAVRNAGQNPAEKAPSGSTSSFLRSFVEFVRGWLRKTSIDAQRGTVPGFLRPIATQQLAENLQLDRRAAENGRKNLPASESQVYDDVEQSIAQTIESELIWQRGALLNNLQAYASRLAVTSAASEFAQLQATAENTLARLRTAHYRAEAELVPLRLAFNAAKSELARFRTEHHLRRPVRESSQPWTTLGFATVLVGVEAILNGFFFAEGATSGFIGGVGTALGISVCNIVFALLLGHFPARWMNYRNVVVRLAGSVLLLIGCAVLLSLHAFAAQLRDVMGLVGKDQPTAAAFERLLTAPWAVNDFSSLYLFLLGVGFAAAAMWKGYFLDDPYPGYGAMCRRAESARIDYGDEHGELFDELEDIKENVVTSLQDGIARLPLIPKQAHQIRTQRDAMVENFRGYETAVATATNQLLARYRSINREYRTSPAPARFDQLWVVPQSYLSTMEVRELLLDIPNSEISITAMLDQLRDLLQRVLGEYEGLMKKFPHAI